MSIYNEAFASTHLMNLYICIGEGFSTKGTIMKTLSVAIIVKNITASIASKGFKEALSWNLVGNRIDAAFLGGFATVVVGGVILDFEVEEQTPFLIKCNSNEAALIFSCFHNKGLFHDVLGSSVYTGNKDSFLPQALEEFNEPAEEKEWENNQELKSRMLAAEIEEERLDALYEERMLAAEIEEERLDALYEEKMLAMEERQYD